MTRVLDFIAGRKPPELYETYLVPGFFTPWAELMMELTSPQGDCLDLACGTGIVSRTILRNAADKPNVTAVDIAPAMIAEAKQHIDGEDVAFHQASADALPFSENSFDVAYCQQGLQFFPDKRAALREVHRVLRPGGIFAAAVWRPAHKASPVFGAFEDVVAKHLGNDLVPLGPFSFGPEKRLRELTNTAGFAIDTLETFSRDSVLPSVEELVLFDILFLGRPGEDGAMQPALAPDDPEGDAIVDRMIADLTPVLADYVGADGKLHAPSSSYMLVARKNA